MQIIKQKFEHFDASKVYYDEIDMKLGQIRADLAEINSIKSRLVLNVGRDTKCFELLDFAVSQEEHLERLLEEVTEREEYLEVVRQDCILNESDEGYFRRNYCSPEDPEEDYDDGDDVADDIEDDEMTPFDITSSKE